MTEFSEILLDDLDVTW